MPTLNRWRIFGELCAQARYALAFVLQEGPEMRVALVMSVAVSIGGAALAPAAAQTKLGPVAGMGTCGQWVFSPPSQFFDIITQFRNGTPTGEVMFASNLVLYGIQITCLINAERTNNQLPQVTYNQALAQAASDHALAASQIRWWSQGADPHTNPQTGSTIDSRIRAAGYCGGNISMDSEIAYDAFGDPLLSSPVGATNWWMNISTGGHRQAILSPAIREIGVGWQTVVADGSVPASSKPAGTFVIDFGACR
ncbi:MAG TPA: CAP domain-containing protein [Xanthobacteraceae bacterium]